MARSFNGTNQKITIASGFEAAPSGPISISCWVFSNQTGATAAIIGCALSAGLEFRQTNNNPPKLEILAENSVSLATSTGTFTINSWHHVGIAFNNTTFAYVFYIDGAAAGSGTAASGISASKGPYAIGENVIGNTDWWSGSLADFAEWNTTLTAAQFASLAKGARPVSVNSANLIAWFPMDGLQSPEPDLSGNAHNGTLVGATSSLIGPPYMQFTPRWPIPTFGTTAAAVAASRVPLRMRMGMGV